MLSCVRRCHTRQEFCNQNQTKSADSHELTASTPTRLLHCCLAPRMVSYRKMQDASMQEQPEKGG